MIESHSKKLILGLISGMSLEKVRPFFLSLEKSGYRGDVCMVVSHLDSATQSFLRAQRVQLIPFQTVYLRRFAAGVARLAGFSMSWRRRRLFEHALAPAYMHPHCARHFFYESYLQHCAADYSHVLLTDVRDVLFQADPFAFELPDGLSVFLDGDGRNIGSCEYNASSMLRGFGRAALRELNDKPVACAGTTIGTTAAIREHLAHVTRLLCAKRPRETIDQGVHNFVIYKEPPAKIKSFHNFSGPVLTMAFVDLARLQFDASGKIVNTNGQIINTLHQYDRHPELAQKLLRVLT